MKDKKPDKIYAKKHQNVSKFSFDEQVVEVFDDMINRSVPLYDEVQDLTKAIASKFYQENSKIYDLGCSTASSLISILDALDVNKVDLVGVDYSKEMISQARKNIEAKDYKNKVEFIEDDIANITPKDSSIIIMNYTLQFVDVDKREALLKKCYDNLLPGGVLFLTEKVKHFNDDTNDLLVDLHHDFKRKRGYSDLEISQKAESIREVLVPEYFDTYPVLLRDIGFKNVEVCLKYYNFTSYLAVK